MGFYTFYPATPTAGNDPADDQPLMTINNASTSGLISQDHVGFNTANGGNHKQVTFNANVTPSSPTDPISVLSTQAGKASTVANLVHTNQNGIFPVSCLRAWGFCNTSGVISLQSVNVTSVTRTSAGVYNVVLATNAVNSANFAVFISWSSGGIAPYSPVYSITGTGTFTLIFRSNIGPVDPANFSFQVLQL